MLADSESPGDVRLECPTPSGPAHLTIAGQSGARTVLVLGHGAGGGIDAPDLVALRNRAVADGVAVVRVTQPYRVAGRRAPAAAPALDAAFSAVVAAVRGRFPASSLVTGGRSSGARVACRTATAVGADAVVALAFPLAPPGRPERSRAGELALPQVPVLVVQGTRDPFGMPEAVAAAAAYRDVRVVAVEGGDHSFRARVRDGRTTAQCLDDVASAVVAFLGNVARPRSR